MVLSTWNHGMPANEAAWSVLDGGGRALDAVEAGVRVPEADPESTSVGYGGLPDREGRVTLDASIMDERGDCGSVAFLQGYKHPISVARKVLEETPHVMLVGKGAEIFAEAQGFERSELLTEDSEARYKEWLKDKEYRPWANWENHDTIGMVAIDRNGDLSGACTTSGLAWKMHGRVGDSPIVGAALFVDNEVGAATATGVGEMVIKSVGSFLIVELMRQGAHPQEACEEAIRRIVRKQNVTDEQVGYLAIDREGRIGAHAVRPGFDYSLTRTGQHELIDATHLLD